MDRLCIPNFTAILPGTADIIWVYSGKGTTRLHAKTGSLMEAIERYSSLPKSYKGKLVQGRYLELLESYDHVLHPAEVVEPVSDEFNNDAETDFLPGFDLLSGEKILVPAEIALYRHFPKHPVVHAFSCFHTNGLASGNVLEEAVCHALCEVIERDAVSIADLCASSIPYNILSQITESFMKLNKKKYPFNKILDGHNFVDDSSMFPEVDISEIAKDFEPINLLLRKFARARIPLTIKDITQQGIGIPTFVASSVEWLTQDYGYFAKGFGTHPDARIALVRAMTEASQTRAINIQGARDDLKRIKYNENDEIYNRKWQFMPAKTLQDKESDSKRNIIKFSKMRTDVNEDILDDINLILRKLKDSGLKRVIIVDLTNPNIGIPVVRVIVPGLEAFEVTQSVMGQRAKQHFREQYLQRDT